MSRHSDNSGIAMVHGASSAEAIRVESLPLGDLQLVVDYKKRASESAGCSERTVQGYIDSLCAFDRALASSAPWLLALPLSKRVGPEGVMAYVATRPPEKLLKNLQVLIAAIAAIDPSADLEPLRTAQRRVYVRHQPKDGSTQNLRWSPEKFKEQFPHLHAALRANVLDARREQLSERSVGFHEAEIRGFLHALNCGRPDQIRDDNSMFSAENVVACFETWRMRGNNIAGTLIRLRNAFRRIGPIAGYDWMDELIRLEKPTYKAPPKETRSLKLTKAEEEKLFAPFFDDNNYRAVKKNWRGWAAATKTNVRSSYCACFGSLLRVAPEMAGVGQFDCFTADTIDLMVPEMLTTCQPQVVKQRLRDLKRLLKRANPDTDYEWLASKASSLKKKKGRKDQPGSSYVPVIDLIRRGLAIMDDSLKRIGIIGESGVGSLRRVAQRYRDGLILVFLGFTPLRGAYLHGVRIGSTLSIDPGGYLYKDISKNGHKDWKRIPEPVSLYLDVYLKTIRPLIDPKCRLLCRGEKAFEGETANGALWVSERGGSVSVDYLRRITPNLADEITSIRVTTHSVRKHAATTAATSLKVDAALAVKLLHHLNPATTETVYILTACNAAQSALRTHVGDLLSRSVVKQAASGQHIDRVSRLQHFCSGQVIDENSGRGTWDTGRTVEMSSAVRFPPCSG